MTRNVAKCVYEAGLETGAPVFDGIRYLSRLSPGREPWTVLAGGMLHASDSLYQRISSDEPDLHEAAEILDIEVE